jgi:hypothetical protein
MTYKVIALEFVVPTLLAIALAIVRCPFAG